MGLWNSGSSFGNANSEENQEGRIIVNIETHAEEENIPPSLVENITDEGSPGDGNNIECAKGEALEPTDATVDEVFIIAPGAGSCRSHWQDKHTYTRKGEKSSLP